MSGCTSSLPNETITDLYTEEEIKQVEMKGSMFVLEYGADNMERGDNPYNYLLRDIVIDPNYYEKEEVQRGDVVYHEQPDEYYEFVLHQPFDDPINRVIALPGETVEIKQGQFYINGKRLDAFYGDAKQNVRSNDFESEYNAEKITIPENHVFLSGDLWWRSIDSKQYGPIPMELIKGKVLGYK
jgi:signal peptidase I